MPDPQDLFRRGVAAIREEKNLELGRQLLTQSLRLDPQNDKAWLWLARTVNDPQKRLEMVERALKINPSNETALALRDRLQDFLPSSIEVSPPKLTHSTPAIPVIEGELEDDRHTSDLIQYQELKTLEVPLSDEERREIQKLLKLAEASIEKTDIEGAIGYWVEVLHIRVDHDVALPNAIRHLTKLKYYGDAEELIWRALGAGSKVETLPDLVIKLASLTDDFGHIDDTRMRLATVSNVPGTLLSQIAEDYYYNYSAQRAFEFVRIAVKSHPNDQKILFRYAQLLELNHDFDGALKIYQRVLTINHRTPEGKTADEKVLAAAPQLSVGDLTNPIYAVREAFGVLILFFFLAWQDAGFSFNMGIGRFVGLLLSMVGGYLLVTATSSADQKIWTSWLPSNSDENKAPVLDTAMRQVMGFVGGVLLVIAFWLCFNSAIDHILRPIEPTDIPTVQEIIEENS